jgi:hypothetical protein
MLLREELGGFKFALTRPHYTIPEKDSAGKRWVELLY